MSSLMTKLIVIGGFLVAFAAGWVTGYQQTTPTPTAFRAPSTAPTTGLARGQGGPGRGGIRPPPPPSILARELNLDTDQRTKLEAIWREVAMVGMREMDQKRRSLREQRDNAVTELLEVEAAEEYRAILSNYNMQLAAMEALWQASYSDGVEKTKGILNPQQVERFEQILRRNTWDPNWGGRGGRGGGGRGQGGGRGGDGNRNDGPRNDGPGDRQRSGN